MRHLEVTTLLGVDPRAKGASTRQGSVFNTAREAKCWGQDYKNKTSVPTMHLWESTQLPLQPIREWHDISTSPGYHHACGIADHRAVC